MQQHRHLIFDRAPNEFMIDEIIAVDQNIAERDDLPIVGNTARRILIKIYKTLDSLADNFKAPLN